MLEFDAVSKRFGTLQALDSVTLQCAPAQTTALLGPSGCGKSTLLRLAIGLVLPDAGVVRVGGRRVSLEALEAIRRRVGYVIQDGGLFPHLDAFGNVTLLARHLGWTRARIADRFEQLRELVKLPSSIDARLPQQLSGGQRQRVSLMRALMLDPELLLLDEPLGALDPMIRRDLQRDLGELFQALRKTVLLVTHDVAEAATLASRLVLLRAGRLVQAGTLEDLMLRPAEAFVAEFVAAHRGAREVLAERAPRAQAIPPEMPASQS